MIENEHAPDNSVDADLDGRLAAALFSGVILILLLMIYGLAMAA